MQSAKNIWLMGWVSFFTDTATAMIKPIIPIYVVVVLHQGVDKLGIVVAVSTFISFALRWLGGWLSDYYSHSKPFLIVGYGLSAITKPLFALTQSWQGVVVLSGTERLGKAVRAASKDKLISLSANSEKQGRAFGLHKTLDISGEVLGALVAFSILHFFGKDEYWIREIFYWTILPSALAMIVLIFFVKEVAATIPPINERIKPAKEHLSAKLRFKLLLYFSTSFLMVGESFMVIRAHEAGVIVSLLPLLLVAGTITQALLSYFAGKSADIYGDEKVLLAGIIAGFIAMILLTSNHHDLVALAFVFQGIFMVTTLNAIRMRLGQFSHSKGKIYGWFYSLYAIVTSVAALVMGALWEWLGGTQTLTVFSACYLLVMLIYLTAHKRFNHG